MLFGNDVARVELPVDAVALAAVGVRFVALDLSGIQSGAFTLPLVAVPGG